MVKQKALDTALDIFQQTKKSNCYDTITFGLIIKACMHLSKDDDERIKLIQPVFELCAENGLVGSMVQREMRHFTGRLMPSTIPQDWRKNAKDK
jgi:hypothetical protein